MASDSARGAIVLFGGDSGGTLLGDTWLWDGTTWNDPSPRFPPQASSPSPRSGHAMTQDSRRRKAVLFGGYDGQSVLSDTWEWDGTAWSQVIPAGASPFPRKEHALAFDPLAGVTVLFGGTDGAGTWYGDTWLWDGTRWTQIFPPQPTPPMRSGHAMTFDQAQSRVVLFGGVDGTGHLNSTWLWNGATSTWTAAAPTTIPPAREGHALAFDPACQGTILIGGGIDRWTVLNDTWQWNGSNWVRRLASNPPGALWWLAVGFDSARQRLLLFEGSGGGGPAGIGTWQWTCGNWVSIHRSTGPPHELQRMAYDTARQRTVLFEASGSGNPATWEWDGSHWREQFPVTTPTAPRQDHAMAYDIRRRVTVLFGGGDRWNPLSDTWAWDGSNWSLQAPPASPSARYHHALAYDAARGVVVLFGGDSPTGRLQSTWTWNGAVWIQHAPGNPPSARFGHALAYDANRQEVILFGGHDGSNRLSDTWAWDGTTWTRRQPSASPTPRRFHAMAYNASRRTVVLFGGEGGSGELQDTWEWNGTNWSQVSASQPVPTIRRSHAMTYDSARQRVVLYGGWNSQNWGTPLYDTWELVPSSISILLPAQRPGPATVTVHVPGDSGMFFHVLLSLGTVPGLGLPPVQDPVFGTVVLPLNFDDLLVFSLIMPFGGQLSPSGTGSINIDLPGRSGDLLTGLGIYVAGATYAPPIRTITPEMFFRLP